MDGNANSFVGLEARSSVSEKGKPSYLRTPPKINNAYSGVKQEDWPSAMDDVGNQKIEEENPPKMTLSRYIEGVFDENRRFREETGIDENLMKRLRQMKDEYDPEDEAEIVASGQPKVYMGISAHKERTLVAWLMEFFSDVQKSFYLKPTPVPELSPDVIAETTRRTMSDWVSEYIQTGILEDEDTVRWYSQNVMKDQVRKEFERIAEKRASKMEKVLKDDLVEGRYSDTLLEFLNYYATYGTAAIRMPVIRLKNIASYENTKYGQKVVDKVRLARDSEAISPFDLFPSNGQKDAQDGDFCIRVRYSPKELRQIVDLPCWFKDNILLILNESGMSGVSVSVASDMERERLEQKDSSKVYNKKILEGVEYWGQASGELLIGLGITRTPDKKPVKEEDWYEINAILMDGKIIYCRVMDTDEERPLDVAQVYNVPGSFWGVGPLEVIDHIQRLCNATTRNLITNMGFASGPQAVIDDASRVHPLENGKGRPVKTWAFTNPLNSPNKPISFWNIPSISSELINVFQFYMRLADELTGIPAYANGTDAATGAARTATGLNMLFGAANRGIKKIVGNIDRMNEKSINRLFWWHMRYSKDESIKGDILINVCGVAQYTAREEMVNKQLQILQIMQNSPRLSQFQTDEDVAKMLRGIATSIDMPQDWLAPDADEMELRAKKAKMAAEEQMNALKKEMVMEQQSGRQQGVDSNGQIPASSSRQISIPSSSAYSGNRETTNASGRPKRPPLPDNSVGRTA